MSLARALMSRPSLTVGVLVLAVSGALVVTPGAEAARGTGSAATAPVFDPPQRYYLSLGDSQGFGLQVDRWIAMLNAGTYTPAAFDTGYTDDFAAMMRQVRPDQRVVNYSCPAADTNTMSHRGCFFTQIGLDLHNNFTGTQLHAAVTFLRAHVGQVSPITLSIGTADLLNDYFGCGQDPGCFLSRNGLLRTGLAHVLAALRTAAPGAEIIVVKPYDVLNPFTPTSPLDPALDQLWLSATAVYYDVAAQYQARVVDGFAAFDGAGRDRICHLTFLCGSGDTHPTNHGYAVLAKRFWAVSGYGSLLN